MGLWLFSAGSGELVARRSHVVAIRGNLSQRQYTDRRQAAKCQYEELREVVYQDTVQEAGSRWG